MKCQKCQQQTANVNLQLNMNGQKQSYQLCSSCYQQERQKLGMSSGGFSSNPLFDFFGSSQPSQRQARQEVQAQPQSGGGNGILDQFGRNLTNLATSGVIDPVIGREKEIRRVIEILNRRNKNNPVLIGEPGVGKTAIAEGLALQIVTGDVPAKLRGKEVYLLDVASLVSGTGIRGQFEERMKQLIAELQSRKNTILFIDEIHQLVGAGSAEGSLDAGNILKPALARGELQLIGATTLNEYRKIEKDAALERRFQPVTVNEPTPEEATQILLGLKEKYEKFHSVTYTDDVLQAAIELSHRYIQDRFLPDKAIDLMDEAGAKLNLTITNGSEEDIQARLASIHKEKETALQQENYEQAAKLRDEEAKLEDALQNNTSASTPAVAIAHLQAIIEEKTGIPVGKLQQDEQIKMKELQSNLAKKVIGQAEAVEKVAKAVRRSRAGLKSKHRPIGSFLFVGPTGVGKTELSKTLAEELFGAKDAFIRLDMSEYMEKHSVSKLIGSPPGYVGHEEAGQLTEQVRRQPYSIVLLDEVEKAHPDVMHMFLQILEDGRLTDSQGRTVNFKDTVIIMTSNAGVGTKKRTLGFGASTTSQEASILESLGSFFKPEFLNRFDSIIEFAPLEKDSLLKIVEIMTTELIATAKEQGKSLQISAEAKEKIVELGYDKAFGARPLRRVIQEYVEDRLADFILEQPDVSGLDVVVEDGEIVVLAR